MSEVTLLEEVVYEIVDLSTVIKQTDKEQPLSVDFETDGLYGTICLAQFYQEGWPAVLLVQWPKLHELQVFFRDCHLIAHNAHYELSILCDGAMCMPKDYDCTYFQSRLAKPALSSHSLDVVSHATNGCIKYKSDQQKSDWTGELTKEQLEYAATDAYNPIVIYNTYKDTLSRSSYKLDKTTLPICIRAQLTGVSIDQDAVEADINKTQTTLTELALPINANSYQQVRKWVGVSASAEEDLLLEGLKNGNQKALDVIKARKLRKRISMLRDYNKPEAFGKFKLGAKSGRTTASDINLQQMPRDFKRFIQLPIDGDEVYVFSDFPQIQMRNVAIIAPDDVLYEKIKSGEDIHAFVAKILFGEGFTKEHRFIAKTANFSLLFGASVNVFRSILLTSNVLLTDTQLQVIIKKWKTLFKGIADWQRKSIKLFMSDEASIGKTPLGRQYSARTFMEFLANQIQGYESEVAKLAWIKMERKITAAGIQADCALFVHDSYMYKTHKDNGETVANIIGESMVEAWTELNSKCVDVKYKDLPLPIVVTVGHNLKDLAEDIGILVKHYNTAA